MEEVNGPSVSLFLKGAITQRIPGDSAGPSGVGEGALERDIYSPMGMVYVRRTDDYSVQFLYCET